MNMPDLIKEIVRLKGTSESVDNELKYLISKFTPVQKSIQIAQQCMDKQGNLILDKLPPYHEIFPPEIIEKLKEFETWQEFQNEYDKVNPTQSVDFDKSLCDILHVKPKKKET